MKGILDWLTPKCVNDVQKFLGLANYYCRFIEGFASIARPLHNMVKKDQKWDWTEKQDVIRRVCGQTSGRVRVRIDIGQ